MIHNIMKMNKLFVFFFCLAGVTFFSCTEMVTDIDLPVTGPKLVVNSYLSPEDSLIIVVLSKSRPLNQVWTETDFSKAVISLVSSQGSIVIPYDEVIGNIFSLPVSSFPIHAGHTYTLHVSLDGFQPVHGTTTIPPLTNTMIEYTGMTRQYDFEMEQFYYFLNFSLTDLPGQENYYYARCLVSHLWDTAYFEELYEDRGRLFLSDKNHDGGKLYYSFRTWEEDLHSVKIELYTTDEAFYRFHRTYFSFTGDDPFAEPVVVYSNINGGLGAVGSYRVFHGEKLPLTSPKHNP